MTDDALDLSRDEAVNAERLLEHAARISAWLRLSGSAEERLAFEYIRDALQRLSIPSVFGEHNALISLPGDASLTVYAHGTALDIPCRTHSFAAATDGLVAPLVRVPERQGTSPAGAIAVVDGVAMGSAVAPLEAQGAAGVIFLNRDPLVHENIVSVVWGSPTSADITHLPRIPIVSLAGRDAQRMRETLERQAAGTTARITAAVNTGWTKLPVLTADIPGGREPTFVLFAGHVDSWHYGAMDNAAGNAVMLEIARILKARPLYRGLRLAFWSGHSHGRFAGSTWYADTHWQELNRRCAAYVYIDSVGGRGATDLGSGYCMPETRAIGQRAIAAECGGTFRGTRVGRAGDQSFLGIGIPSLFMTLSEQPAGGPHASLDFSVPGSHNGGLGWWWHTTEDTVDKLDPLSLARDAQIYLHALSELCRRPVLPFEYGVRIKELHAELTRLACGLQARFDLGPALDAAAGLRSIVDRVEKRAACGGDDTPMINEVLLQFGRTLIPALDTYRGRFGHDPTLPRGMVPMLDCAERLSSCEVPGDEAASLSIELQRAQNRLLDALSRAATAGEAFLARMS